MLEIAAWSARVDAETEAPIEWVETVARNKPEMLDLVTTTVRNGGAVFVGEDSVIARLQGAPV